MKILLTHAYTKENKGDAAIVSVLLGQLERAFPGANITVSISDDDTQYKEIEGHKVISNSMYHSVHRFRNVLLKTFYLFYRESALLAWALLYRCTGRSISLVLPKSTHKIAREYLESDLFVAAGGGYLRTKKGVQENIVLLLQLNPLIIGILLRKPIILYTQSVGPFAMAFQGRMTGAILNKTRLILAREDHTLVTLKRIGVRANLVSRATDAGFRFHSDSACQLADFVENSETLKAKTLVGITVRKWLDQKGQKHFERAIASFVDRVTREEKDLCILFIPQVTSIVHNDDDRDVARRIVSLVANKQQVINCVGDYDHYELKKLYSCLDFLIGTRFHSVIFSLTSYVPAVAIEYEYKTSGIMRDLELSEWVIPIEKVTDDNLYEKFSQLLNEGESYKQKLQKVLPSYVLKAEVEGQMKEAYYSTSQKD